MRNLRMLLSVLLALALLMPLMAAVRPQVAQAAPAPVQIYFNGFESGEYVANQGSPGWVKEFGNWMYTSGQAKTGTGAIKLVASGASSSSNSAIYYPLNAEAYSNLALSVWYKWVGSARDAQSWIEVSYDGGASYSVLRNFIREDASTTTYTELQLPFGAAADHNPNVRVRLRTANGDANNFIAIDDFKITYTPAAVTSVELTPSSLELNLDQSATVTAAVYPSHADQRVVWSVDNPDTVSLDPLTGTVTALKAGSAILRATSVVDSVYYAEAAITVIPAAHSRELTAFTLRGPGNEPVAAGIDQETGRVTAILPSGSFLNQTAEFTITGERVVIRHSDGSETEQLSGITSNNFALSWDNPLTYRVYARNGTFRDYSVQVKVRDETEKKITRFGFDALSPAAAGVIAGHEIFVTVPEAVNRTTLAASFDFIGNRVEVNGVRQESGVTVNDFTRQVLLSVYADDGSSVQYRVTVNKQLPAVSQNLAHRDNGVTGFVSGAAGGNLGSLIDGAVSSNWRRSASDPLPVYAHLDLGKVQTINRITIKEGLRGGGYRVKGFAVYTSTDSLTWRLAVDRTAEGEGAIGESATIDFPTADARYVRLLITADDSLDLVVLTEVELYYAPVPAAALTLSDTGLTLLTGEHKTLQAQVTPAGADRRVMWASSDPAVAAVGNDGTISGVSAGTATIYAYSAADLSLSASLTVTVEPQISTARAFTSFTLDGITPPASGKIEGQQVLLRVPHGTDVTRLAPVFTTTGTSVQVNGTEQTSGVSVQNFTQPIVYRVYSADGQYADITVAVEQGLLELTGFRLEEIEPQPQATFYSLFQNKRVEALGDGLFRLDDRMVHHVALTVPADAVITNLAASFSAPGSTVYIGDNPQVSGVTRNDFTKQQIYRLVGEDGGSKEYAVSVYRSTDQASVTVYPEITGKSLEHVGTNSADSNIPTAENNSAAWYKYGGVNAVRLWQTPGRYVNASNVSSGESQGIVDLSTFDAKKNDLRAKMKQNPEDSTYINWANVIQRNTDLIDPSKNVRYTNKYALDQFKQAGIEIMAEIQDAGGFTTNWTTDAIKWQRAWSLWQQFYAQAFYLAKNYDVRLFEGTNEPDLVSGIPGTAEERRATVAQYVFINAVFSDAIKAAVRDVNHIYGKNLVPLYGAPTLAQTFSSDFGMGVLQNNRINYRGETVDEDIADIYIKHNYSNSPVSYSNEIRNIRDWMKTYSPSGEELLVSYTEFNYSTGADWRSKTETGDSPIAFMTEAQVWPYTMEAGASLMYQFNYASTSYTNGNHMNYMYNQSRDPVDNLLYGVPLTASSEEPGYPAGNVLKGSVTNDYMWKSKAGTAGPHYLEFDLQGEKNITGFAVDPGIRGQGGASEKPLASALLQYWDNAQSKWVTLPYGDVNANMNRYRVLDAPVAASKIRFYSTDSSQVSLRRLYVTDQPWQLEIGGPMKSSEVTRLFAEGFKDSRDLYRTEAQAPYENSYKGYTSYDPGSDSYYLWLPQTSIRSDYLTTIDLSRLPVKPGDLVTIKEVSDRHFGQVVYSGSLSGSKSVVALQPKQSVWLVKISGGGEATEEAVLAPTDDAVASLGANAGVNNGGSAELTVRQHTGSMDNNHAAYLKFDLDGRNPSEIRKALLRVNGKKLGSAGSRFSVYVYGLANDSWDENTLTADNAPNLGRGTTIITHEGTEPVAHLTFGDEDETIWVDVTRYVQEHPDQLITFAIVREKRNEADFNDTDYVTLYSKDQRDAGKAPALIVWSGGAAAEKPFTLVSGGPLNRSQGLVSGSVQAQSESEETATVFFQLLKGNEAVGSATVEVSAREGGRAEFQFTVSDPEHPGYHVNAFVIDRLELSPDRLPVPLSGKIRLQ